MTRELLDKKAIVPAAFGSTNPKAIGDILRVTNRIRTVYPGVPVHLAFTSRIIRRVWRKRASDPKWRADHPDIPDEIFRITSPLTVIADLIEREYSAIAVQPLHIYAGEEFFNLKSYVDALNGIRTMKPKHQPFKKLVLGRPALGEPGVVYDYKDDLALAVQAVRADAERASREEAALVYMGHGNNFMSSGIYLELQEELRKAYPGTSVFVGVVEGFPGLDKILRELKLRGIRRVLLAPFLLAVGEHAVRDMVGEGERSWKTILEGAGIEVLHELRGLAGLDAWVDIYINHLADLFNDHGIDIGG